MPDALGAARLSFDVGVARQRGVDHRKIITADPKIRNGQPCFRGMPITVREVIEGLASGKTIEEVRTMLPKLNHEDIRACLLFSAEGG